MSESYCPHKLLLVKKCFSYKLQKLRYHLHQYWHQYWQYHLHQNTCSRSVVILPARIHSSLCVCARMYSRQLRANNCVTLVSATLCNVLSRTERYGTCESEGTGHRLFNWFVDDGSRRRRRWEDEMGKRNKRGQLESSC